MAPSKRLNYIDALRGTTMFLVVFGHILTFSLGAHHSFLSNLFLCFRMPTFFFISGFVAYKAVDRWSGALYRRMVGKKLVVQIIPASFFFCLYYLLLGKNPLTFFLAHGFQGYWFTFVLLVMLLIFFTISWMAKLAKRPWLQDVGLVVVAVACAVATPLLFHNDTLNNFSVNNLCRFFQFFTLGVLTRKYYANVTRLLTGNWAVTFTLAVFVASLFLLFHPAVTLPKSLWWLLRLEVVGYAGVVLIFAFFYRHRAFFDNTDNRLVRCMLYVGQRTLDIYLIHYFFVPNQLSFMPELEGISQFVVHFLVAAAGAIVITALSLAVSRVIRLSPFLGHYLLGAKR